MSQQDAKAGTGPPAPEPQRASTARASAAAAEAPGGGSPKPAEQATPARPAAGEAATGDGSGGAGARRAPAGGSGARTGGAAARAATGGRAARRGTAGARSTAAVSARPGGGPAAAAGNVSRRGFLSWITAGWLAFGALTAGTLIGTVRYLFPNVLFEPPQTFRAGFPEEYTVGDVSTRFKDQFGVWIVRTTTEIYVLSTTCTHLGCTPNWLSGEQKFKCPCHGSGFRKTGINFEGPAPRPLERFRVALADDGQILVDKTRKYQWEKGEWSDPESFLAG